MASIRFLAVILGVLALIPQAHAFSVFNIYIDEVGDSVFLGESDLTNGLPEGLIINSNGEVTGVTSALTSKNGDVWTFEFELAETDMSIFLPKEATITSVSGGEITLNGDRIVIFVQDAVSISYMLGENIEVPAFPIESLLWIIGIGFMAVVIFYFLNKHNREKEEEYISNKKEPEQHKKLDMLRGVLSMREQEIMDKLKEKKEMKSSFLRRELDMPKASFSRHVQELEKKGLITREGEGRNKIIKIAEDIK